LGVLMPVYSGDTKEAFQDAWESIYIHQTRKADEYVIVKDGPVDNDLLNYIKYLEQLPIVKVVSIEKNVGLPNALNAGLDVMKASWVIRADSDDINIPIRIDRIYNGLENKYVLYTSPVLEFIDDPNVITSIRGCKDRFGFLLTNPINHASSVFSRSAAIDVGKYRDFKFFEDIDLWIRLTGNSGKIKCDEKPLVKFRMNEQAFRRRMGLVYLKHEYKFLVNCYSEGYITIIQLIIRIIIGFFVRNLSSRLYQWLISNLLRKRYVESVRR